MLHDFSYWNTERVWRWDCDLIGWDTVQFCNSCQRLKVTCCRHVMGWNLKIEAVCFPEKLVSPNKNTECHNDIHRQEYKILQWHSLTRIQGVTVIFTDKNTGCGSDIHCQEYRVWQWYSPARPRTQHGYHHNTKVKPEAATAVIELLMMGGRTPETFWAVIKRQDNKLENCCIWLVNYLNWWWSFSIQNVVYTRRRQSKF
jgi:hypothetical protein